VSVIALASQPAANSAAPSTFVNGDKRLSGGALTHFESSREAFSKPASNLSPVDFRAFNFGNRLFNTNWTVAPASAQAFDGLGPLFNRVSCSGCHLRDGRGRPPLENEREMLSMIVRVSVPGVDPQTGGPKSVPEYGTQISDRAIPGVQPEAAIRISYMEMPGVYVDGAAFSLRKPIVRIVDPAYGELPKNMLISARVAPAMVGMGLLENVSAQDLYALEDPDDRNGDGVRGTLNHVWDHATKSLGIGRFGWKAGTTTLRDQAAAAAFGDIGLTSGLFTKKNCEPLQIACLKLANGGTPEMADEFLKKITQYLQMIGVPARRNVADPAALRGEQLFEEIGCAGCHRPLLKTSPNAKPALLANQIFAAYTDLLVHDMGKGLSDNREEFLANGNEWRTQPLWGLGLIETVNGHTFLLHDGRARNISEAILWHAGEAFAAREKFRAMGLASRQDVLAFLNSL
jgi:CxxC motif-containing protein (DUF1111 family)